MEKNISPDIPKEIVVKVKWDDIYENALNYKT